MNAYDDLLRNYMKSLFADIPQPDRVRLARILDALAQTDWTKEELVEMAQILRGESE